MTNRIDILAPDPKRIVEDWFAVLSWLSEPQYRFSSAQTAIDQSYHFGGWSPFEGFDLNPKNGVLSYPGDPDMRPLWKMVRIVEGGEEQEPYAQTVYGYPYAWVAVVNEDGSFQVARID